MRRRRHNDLAAELAQGLLASVAAGALLRRALRTSRRYERSLRLPILLLPPVAPVSVRARVEQIADRNPEQIAAQIRAWLRDR
jgi:flagellar biosynthesis/type III secretory pathway M-ring protein FliF/YscJ